MDSRRMIWQVAVLTLVLGSPIFAQTRWDDLGQRNRDSFSTQRGQLWQGSNWLERQTSQADEWRLGVRADNTEVGVVVREVIPGSAAARARIEVGDVIVTVGGYQVGLVAGRLYDLSEEINRQADVNGNVVLVIQDHRNFGLSSVRVKLDDQDQKLTGSLVYRNRTSLPPDAIVTVQIENLSRPIYQVRHGQTSFRVNSSGEIPFEIAYDPTYINPQDVYQVRAFVTSNGRTVLDTPQPQRVITKGNPSNVRMQLESLVSTLPAGTSGGVVKAGYPNFNDVNDRLIQMYRRYLGREPTYLELAALRATPGLVERIDELPLELMAAQEYFDAAGNHNRVWLEKVFEEIVRRRPSPSELEQWMLRYADLRYSRTELLRQLDSQVRR